MAITYHAGRRIQGTSTEDGLIAQLKFNDNVTDSAGSNNGTVTGTTTYVTGKIGKAFSFNGSSYVKLANETNFDFERTDPFSVSLWINPTTNSNLVLFGKGTTNFTATGFYLVNWNIGGGQMRFRFMLNSGGTNYEIIATANTVTSTTYHLTCTYDGSSNKSGLKIYVNGSEDISGTNVAISGSILNNEQFTIGATSAGTSPINAWIDDVRVYSKTLSTDEISEIYNAGSGTESRFRLPANVQVGSRYEETDTRKMYHYNDTLSVTQDFDSNTGHTVNQTTVNGWYAEDYTKIAYDGTNHYLKYAAMGSTNWGASFDLQQSTNGGFGSAISNTKWTLRFTWHILTNSGNTGNGSQGALGISSVPATTLNSQDFMGFSMRQHASGGEVGIFNATLDNNNPMNQGSSAKKFFTGNLTAGTTYYAEIIRDGDKCTTTLRTGSHTGTSVGTIDITVTGISGLRYLYYKAQQDSGSATHTSYVDDIEFYNGVTATGNAWTEEGT